MKNVMRIAFITTSVFLLGAGQVDAAKKKAAQTGSEQTGGDVKKLIPLVTIPNLIPGVQSALEKSGMRTGNATAFIKAHNTMIDKIVEEALKTGSSPTCDSLASELQTKGVSPASAKKVCTDAISYAGYVMKHH